MIITAYRNHIKRHKIKQQVNRLTNLIKKASDRKYHEHHEGGQKKSEGQLWKIESKQAWPFPLPPGP